MHNKVASPIMLKRLVLSAGACVAVMAIAGCSSSESAPAAQPATQSNSSAATAPDPTEALTAAAVNLDNLIAAGDVEGAWAMYSQRCRNLMVTPETFKVLMEVRYKDRKPHITDHTVRVNGSSGQVVSVDADPAAPADAMNPRTWTFIDDRWQFDNC